MPRYKKFRPKRITVNIGNRNITENQNPQEFDAQKGFRLLEAELSKFIEHMESNMGIVIEDGLEPILDYSRTLVPRKTGALHDSSYTASTRLNGRVVAEIGYARGGFPDYAVIVHEDLNKFHEYPTQAKYLEDAINIGLADFEEFLESAVKDMAGF